jgi:Nif11 domain
MTATGLQAALDFIRVAHGDDDLQRELAALGDDVAFERIVDVAARAGYAFSAEELQRAHAHDWRIRWARFHAA